VFIAALVSVPVSLLLGSLTALRRDSKFDTTTTVGSLGLAALPEFVIGILLILLFATQVFHVLPAVSRVDSSVPIVQQLELFILPALTLTLAVAPYITRILRASTIEVLESECAMAFRASPAVVATATRRPTPCPGAQGRRSTSPARRRRGRGQHLPPSPASAGAGRLVASRDMPVVRRSASSSPCTWSPT
jgi:hypothetical protein